MEEFIKQFVQKLGPTFSTIIGGIALASVIIPYLVKVWEAWGDARSGKRALAAERERLELSKLWLEVEALRQQHNLTPPFPIPPPVMPTPSTPTQIRIGTLLGKLATSPGKPGNYPGVWRWLAALEHWHRMLSTAALFALGICVLPLAAAGMFVVVGAFLTISQAPEDIGFALFITAFEVGLLVLVRSLHRQFSLLKLGRQAADLQAARAEQG